MKPARILIVDDDRDFAEGLADVLTARGYAVELAYSGEEAIAKLREDDFDVTFMDVRLPGKNGVESFLEIRKTKPCARVIMMTGYSVEQLLKQAVDNGACAVLHKPLNPRMVLKMLADIMPAGILIADDDSHTVELVRDTLEERGYKVFSASNGREAIEQVQGDGIDILILDLRLPILNGLEVYLELKRMGLALPTIILTAYAKEEAKAMDEVPSLSAQGILRKPFDPKDLIDKVESLMYKKEKEGVK